jgi:transcriptional regulator with XRE-family HTH domain
MYVKIVTIYLWIILTDMKNTQANTLNDKLASQLRDIGALFPRLRIARRITQSDAAIRAGISRTTASLIENGSPSVAIGQVLRYLDAIAPGKKLSQLLSSNDPSVLALEEDEQRKRARKLSPAELKALDF